MFFNLRKLAGGCALLVFCATAAGQDAALTKEEIQGAIRTDDFSIPMPAELMAALNKQGKLDWASRFRPPIATSYTSRAALALNLGTLVADGFIAVEAEDSQQVKNLGKDILQLAKNLGVPKDILMRGSSITDFAERKLWDQLKEELEATENEVKNSMRDNKDSDLVTLVTVGAFARGIDVVSSQVADKYNEASAKVLRQPGVSSYLNMKLETLSEKVREELIVKTTQAAMKEIDTLLTFPRDKAPTLDEVKNLHQAAAALVKEISRKESQ